jgi:hypothetical protein
MAASGTVRVTATQNGNPIGPYELEVEVTDRNATTMGWIDSLIEVDTISLAETLVVTGADLGETESFFLYSGDPWTVIQDGPNQGWLLPGELYARHFNPVGNLSPATSQNKCNAGVIVGAGEYDLRRSIEKHEGTNWDPGSHTAARRATLAAEKAVAQSAFEIYVVENTPSETDLFFDLFDFSISFWGNDGVDPWVTQLDSNCVLIRVNFQ